MLASKFDEAAKTSATCDAIASVNALPASFAKVRRMKGRLPELKVVALHDVAAREVLAGAAGLVLPEGENPS